MSLRFSEYGPEFPDALVKDLLLGEVVFLCGAGVSAPQLPGFKGLVDEIYEQNGWEIARAEKLALEKERYEEALGTLGRRLANPQALYDSVAKILSVPVRPDLANHQTLLRLSRRLDGRPALVTTNFDTMFERAAERREGKGEGRRLSSAGESLPGPGNYDFKGIIHLHGRIEDTRLRLRRTNLVLTSAEYGDAYMRSGWAARFLFDLARCRTVVLVGYSAGDAPVRYFLNVLEADRDRFPDLKTVYALDAIEDDSQAAVDTWTALAVRALPYKKTQSAEIAGGHGALWRDLQKLADVIERPVESRRSQVASCLSRSFQQASDQDRATIAWALTDRRDHLAWP
jgi:SIR2-like protein